MKAKDLLDDALGDPLEDPKEEPLDDPLEEPLDDPLRAFTVWTPLSFPEDPEFDAIPEDPDRDALGVVGLRAISPAVFGGGTKKVRIGTINGAKLCLDRKCITESLDSWAFLDFDAFFVLEDLETRQWANVGVSTSRMGMKALSLISWRNLKI